MPLDPWPPGTAGNPFPQGLFMGVSFNYGPGVTYSETGTGPGKRRRRGTRQREFHSTPYQLTGAQVAIFDEWFENVIFNGSAPFTWTNMKTGLPCVYIFKEEVRPDWDLNMPGNNYITPPDEAGGESQKRYNGTISLELLPQEA